MHEGFVKYVCQSEFFVIFSNSVHQSGQITTQTASLQQYLDFRLIALLESYGSKQSFMRMSTSTCLLEEGACVVSINHVTCALHYHVKAVDGLLTSVPAAGHSSIVVHQQKHKVDLTASAQVNCPAAYNITCSEGHV